MFKDQSLASNSQHKCQVFAALCSLAIYPASKLPPNCTQLAIFLHNSIQAFNHKFNEFKIPRLQWELIDEFNITTVDENRSTSSKPPSLSSSRTSQNLHSYCILRISKIHWSTTWTKDHRVSTKAVYKSVYNYKSTSFCCCNQFCGYL